MRENEVKKAQKEKCDIINALSTGINHDISNPLGIARGQCEMFLLNLADGIYKDKSHEELLEKASDIMRKVIRETDRAAGITRKLSAFAKCLKREEKENVEIQEEIERALSDIQQDDKLKKIKIQVDIHDKKLQTSANRRQIQEILKNVIRNAAEAAGSKGKVEIEAKKEGKGLCIIIKDNGRGIADRDIDKVFAPFFSTKQAGYGSGLGLFITKELLEKNNGTIQVESKTGKGTVFTINFL